MRIKGFHKSLVVIAAVCLFFCLFLDQTYVDAVEKNEIDYTNRETGKGYHATKGGASWYYYKIEEGYDIDANIDKSVAIPFNTGYGKQVIISKNELKNCQENGGGMWILMANEYNVSNEELTGKPAISLKIKDVFDYDTANGLYLLKDGDSTKYIDDKSNDGGIFAQTVSNNNNKVKEMFEQLVGTDALKNRFGIQKEWGEGSSESFFCAGGNLDSLDRELQSYSTVSVNTNRAGLVSSTGVLNGVSQMNGEQVVAKGEIILTFEHYIVRRKNDSTNKTINWSINRPTGEGDYSATDFSEMSGTVNMNSASWQDYRAHYQRILVGKSEAKLFMEKDKRATICQSMAFNPLKYKVEAGTITFNDYSYSEMENSKACITMRAENDNAMTSCHDNQFYTDADSGKPRGNFAEGSKAAYAHVPTRGAGIGNTVGAIGVINYNSKSSNKDDKVLSDNILQNEKTHYFMFDTLDANSNTGAFDSARVYAKPGDNVGFSYAMCFGAQTVYNDNSNPDRYVTKQAISGGFKITATFLNESATEKTYQKVGPFQSVGSLLDADIAIIAGSGAEAIYNQGLNQTNTKTYIVNQLIANGRSETEAKKVIPHMLFNANLFGFSFTSPDSRDKDTPGYSGNTEYSCEAHSSLNPSMAGAFQVPGLGKNSTSRCDSSNAISKKVSTYEDTNDDGFPDTWTTPTEVPDKSRSLVGYSILRTLSYKNIQIWPSDYIDYDTAFANTLGATYGDGRKTNADASGNFPDVEKSARVIIPYNFSTELHSEIRGSDQIVYAGEPVTSYHFVKINPRSNPLVNDEPYATITPDDTQARTIEYLVPEYKDLVNDDVSEIYIDSAFQNDPCAYFTGKWESGGYVDNSLKPMRKASYCSINGSLPNKEHPNGDPAEANPESSSIGATFVDTEVTRAVPDYKVGYKYCIAAAINHGDSHGNDGYTLNKDPSYKDTSNSGNIKPAELNDTNITFGANSLSVSIDGVTPATTSQRWHIAAASCRTIAKKPTFQVWNGGTYSSGNIITSISRKQVNSNLGDDYKSDNDHTRLFGSWDQYHVLSGGTIEGFGSGSGLGFSDWLSSKGQKNADIYEDYCKISRMSIANIKCQSNVAGSAAGPVNDNMIDRNRSFLLRFYDRYTNGDGTGAGVKNAADSFNILHDKNYTSLKADSAIGTNIWKNSNCDRSPNKKEEIYTSGECYHLPEGEKTGNARYIKIIGDYILNEQIVQVSGTRIIEVEGTLTINQNLCLRSCMTDGKINSGDSEDLSGLDKLPQIIIIADNIEIGENVEQIDAWLIAGKPVGTDKWEGGYINTCSGITKIEDLDASKCNKLLKVNGPVFASQIYLRRTAGAWPGYNGTVFSDNFNDSPDTTSDFLEKNLNNNGSITPSEIFDVRPDTYLWAYYQAQRFTHAIITYQKEYAPRL